MKWQVQFNIIKPYISSGCFSWGGTNFVYRFHDQYHLSSGHIIGWELMDVQAYANLFIYLFNKSLLKTNYITELMNVIMNLHAKEWNLENQCLLRNKLSIWIHLLEYY